jgi:hypothetical protein
LTAPIKRATGIHLFLFTIVIVRVSGVSS